MKEGNTVSAAGSDRSRQRISTPTDPVAELAILDAVRDGAPGPVAVDDLPVEGNRRSRLVDELTTAGLLERVERDAVTLTRAAETYQWLVSVEPSGPSTAKS
jgi:hypothetical protein